MKAASARCSRVLAGKIEVYKTFDGVERRLGWRLPGTVFGEVPLALGTPFPGGYRAAEPSRVMRVEAQHYYAIAAASPEVAMKMGALARERIGGLQGIAAEPPKARVTMVGHRWDAACSDVAPLPRAQPDQLRLADAGCAASCRRAGRARRRRTRIARRCGSRTAR